MVIRRLVIVALALALILTSTAVVLAQDGAPPPTTPTEGIEAFSFCQQVPSGSQRQACIDCLGQADDVSDRIFTAVGCLRTSPAGLAGDLIRLGLGIGGGVALLSILAAGFIYTTSQGDQNKLKNAKDLATGAVSGLLFMIFSIIILNFIGVEILRIPGLGGEVPTTQAPTPPPDDPEPTDPEQPVDPPPEPEHQPDPDPDRVWSPEEVVWLVRQDQSHPGYVQFCISYPVSGAQANDVSVVMRPVIGDHVYEFFNQPLSPPQENQAGNFVQCGSIEYVGYSAGLVRNAISQRVGVTESQQIRYDGDLVDGGTFNIRSGVVISQIPGAQLTDEQRDLIFNQLPGEFQDRLYTDVHVNLNGESIHQYQLHIDVVTFWGQ